MTGRDPVVIVDGARTPMGGFQGDLKELAAPALGSVAIKGALERAGVAPEAVEEVIMGCVLPAGLGQAPARQAAHGAGIPWDVGCTTINKMCGSGMKATMLAHDLIHAEVNKVMLAGGLESMTNAPYLSDKARAGLRMGHAKLSDHMFLDGLEDAYDKGRLMGSFAEDAAQHFQFTREAQDAFAIASLNRAKTATEDGTFAKEIAAVTVKGRAGDRVVAQDEQPLKADVRKIPTLRPAFREGGTVTAANSSSISDGAAALVLMKRSEAEKRGLAPRAQNSRPFDARGRARLVHDGAGRRDPEALGQARLEVGRRRSLRDQRGVRGRHHGGDARAQPSARQGQRPWRGVRARPSDRRVGRAHHRDTHERAREISVEARHGLALHRRRRGHGDRHRAAALSGRHRRADRPRHRRQSGSRP